jgi:hypothetical protein
VVQAVQAVLQVQQVLPELVLYHKQVELQVQQEPQEQME